MYLLLYVAGLLPQECSQIWNIKNLVIQRNSCFSLQSSTKLHGETDTNEVDICIKIFLSGQLWQFKHKLIFEAAKNH